MIAIVLIPINYGNARHVINMIDGSKYSTTTALRIQLAELLEVKAETDIESDVEIYNLPDFTTACNDIEINIDCYYLAYVEFEK